MGKDIDTKTINHLSDLAMLELSDSEKEKLKNELNVILDAVKKVSELDLKNVEGLNNPIELVNVYREDKIKPSISVEDALKNAPNTEDNQFKVVKILKNE